MTAPWRAEWCHALWCATIAWEKVPDKCLKISLIQNGLDGSLPSLSGWPSEQRYV